MRIISLSIINFGGLHNLELNFETGLNTICEQNGWGKSTVTAFIKVMLYGFDGEASKDPIAKERKRYSPWNGGTYGGSMVFSVGDRKYTVTRIFREKKSLDGFELRDFETNMPSSDYSEALGEEIFKINSESFMKTILIRQNNCASTGTTGDIDSKLGNISDSIDLNCFEQADELLKEYINSLYPARKNSETGKLKTKASELKAEISDKTVLSQLLSEARAHITEYLSKIETDNREFAHITELRKQSVESDRRKRIIAGHRNLSDRISEKQDELNAVTEGKIEIIPDKQSVANWNTAINKYREIQNDHLHCSLSTEEQINLNELDTVFAGREYSSELFETLIDKGAVLDALKHEQSDLALSEAEMQTFMKYSSVFKNMEHPADSVGEMIELNDSEKKLQNANSLLMSEINAYEKLGRRNNNMSNITACILGVLSVLTGSGLLICSLFMKNNVIILPGCMFVIFGIILMTVYFTGLIKHKKDYALIISHLNDLNNQISANEAETVLLYQKITDFLNMCGVDFEGEDYDVILKNMLMWASDLESLENRKQKYALESKREETESITRELNDFLNEIGITALENISYEKELIQIRADYREYLRLLEKKKSFDAALELKEKISKYFHKEFIKAGVRLDDTDLIKTTSLVLGVISEAQVILQTMSELTEMKAETERDNPDIDFEQDNSITETDTTGFDERETELKAEIESLQLKIDEDRNRAVLLERQLERYNEISEEIEALEREIKEKCEKYDIAMLTRKYLTEAKEKLTSRYRAPVLKGFGKYYTMLTGEPCEGFFLDANLNITREEEGLQRNPVELSQGYQDLIGLCMRLALADAMYPGEKPLLILDDPFVNLDDDKLEHACSFLSKASLEYQIIYFTCSRSRI